MLVRRAITASDYTIYILLLDIPKAFNTFDSKKLFEYMEETLTPDKLHLLNILCRCPKVQNKVANKTGNRLKPYLE